MAGLVVREEEVLREVVVVGVEARRSSALVRDVELPVPRVERPVVTTLAAEVEEQVLVERRVAAEAVVKVYASARTIEADVSVAVRVRRLRLLHATECSSAPIEVM